MFEFDWSKIGTMFVNPWISVDDRLPDEDQVVLITGISYGERLYAVASLYASDSHIWFVDGVTTIGPCGGCSAIFDAEDHVTHWMPLPQFPEENE